MESQLKAKGKVEPESFHVKIGKYLIQFGILTAEEKLVG